MAATVVKVEVKVEWETEVRERDYKGIMRLERTSWWNVPLTPEASPPFSGF